MSKQNPGYDTSGHYARHSLRAATDATHITTEPEGGQTHRQVRTLACSEDHPLSPSFSLATQVGWHEQTTEGSGETDGANAESPQASDFLSSELPQAESMPSATNVWSTDFPTDVLPFDLASSFSEPQ